MAKGLGFGTWMGVMFALPRPRCLPEMSSTCQRNSSRAFALLT